MLFDFESIKTRMTNSLRSKASWADILYFSTNNRLIDTVAESLAELASYDEFLARNCKWDLANQKSALTTQAQFLQYDPYRKIGATGYIRISSDSNFNGKYSKIISIPKWTIFSDGDEIKFCTIKNESLLTTENYTDVEVVQGDPKTLTFIAAGDDYEEISLVNDSIENVYYDLYVNDELWTEVNDLNSSDSTAKVYTLKNKVDFSGIDIQFGNGIFGKKLDAGDTILFKYVETKGYTGNISSVNIVTTIESTIYDIDSDIVTMYCKNTGNLDGGKDEETIDSIRADGTATFQTGDKAVSQSDYEIKLAALSYIFKVTVWGAYEQNIDDNRDPWEWIETVENLVYASAFTPAGVQLTNAQKTSAVEAIRDDKPPTDIVSFVDVDFIYIIFHIAAFVEDRSNVLSEVRANIITSLESEYSLANMEFFEHLYDTVWKSYVKGLTGITYHTSYIEIAYFPTFKSGSPYLADLNLDIYPIKTLSIKVYVLGGDFTTYTLMGTDDGVGGFIAESPFDLTGSTIDYTTGVGILRVVSGLSGVYTQYTLKVLYQCSADDLILKNRNQIFKVYNTDDVTAEYIEVD